MICNGSNEFAHTKPLCSGSHMIATSAVDKYKQFLSVKNQERQGPYRYLPQFKENILFPCSEEECLIESAFWFEHSQVIRTNNLIDYIFTKSRFCYPV